ncbi:MAG: peptidase M15 [Tannerellaceae bacterium]|jgi:hypothetical protein|nr:peptidase M15 [Tannerellaceae bacterium]
MTDRQFDEYFSLHEFVQSKTADEHGIDNWAYLNEDAEERLRFLVQMFLTPLRCLVGKPVIIDSGFRCEDLNKVVGGVPTSQHRLGEAADIRIMDNGIPSNELFGIITGPDFLVFDQCILYKTFVHVSLRNPIEGKVNRQEAFAAKTQSCRY